MGRLTGKSVPVMPKLVDSIYMTAEYALWAKKVKARAGYRCELCGRSEERMFADHIKEIKDDGSFLDIRNGQCLCGSCHTKKTHDHKRLRMNKHVGGITQKNSS